MSPTLAAGKLNKLISIQRPGPLDANGQPSPEWLSELVDIPARVQQLSGLPTGPDKFWDPRAGNSQLIPTESHRVTIRYLDGLDATRRIVWQGKVLKILSVSDYESRNIYMLINCQEQVGVTDAGAPYAPPPLSSYTGASGPRRYAITGTIDGVNMSFTLPGNPDPAVLVIVWNGVQMAPPGSYTLGTFSGGVTPLTTLFAPKPGDDFYAIF
jgi:head-tail adaptor